MKTRAVAIMIQVISAALYWVVSANGAELGMNRAPMAMRKRTTKGANFFIIGLDIKIIIINNKY
jgi:hypothetical protein